ncbi:uncharacterized protein LOC111026650 isoform X1 [Myzus persicae]|uniref:uncharacterized protein LOC111026650 isoform X1 n=1 Tax=Myzus persicae TaxID=13164 RepID=UPI000B93A02B|nr:uncharacterized protein LOC111026650 isoform X1 [Myzus persicae]
MPVCVFEGCMSGSKQKNLVKPKNVHLHRFPKDVNLRNKWLNQITRGSSIKNVNFEKAVVCSLHFGPQHMVEKPLVFDGIASPKCARRLKHDDVPLRYLVYYQNIGRYFKFKFISSINGHEYSSPINCPHSLISTPSGTFKVTSSLDDNLCKSNVLSLNNSTPLEVKCKKNLFDIDCDDGITFLPDDSILLQPVDDDNSK